MIPFILEDAANYNIQPGDNIYIPGIREFLLSDREEIEATLYYPDSQETIILKTPGLTREERDIILAGCLINYYAQQ